MTARPVFSTLLLTCSVLLAHSVSASIFVVGQDRRVATTAFVTSGGLLDDEQFQEVAPDAGPFDVSIVAQAGIPDGEAQASGSQISVIAPTFIRAEGTAYGLAEIFSEEATAYAAASSNVAIRFMLTQSANFTITGFIESEDTGVITVALSRPFETVAWHSATNQHIDLKDVGALEADTYDLNITCSGNGSAFDVGTPESGSTSYYVLFALGGATDVPTIAAPTAAVLASPNPFRDDLRLTLPDGVRAVRILDARGRVVRTLEGSARVTFDGRDAAGRSLSSGVYWVRPVGVEGAESVKVVRVR